ncbi:MAG: hypothetical protein ABEJ30_02680 [Halorientalis sp.]
MNIPSPLTADDPSFDGYDEFVPETLPEPGAFLADHDVLTGRAHAAFHRATRDVFAERGVYDMTFGYNLARLNLDARHPDAGFRYAVERPDAADAVDGLDGDDPVLRAEFTPTTAFCPQSDTLSKGAFRAWNGLADRHEYALVRVRVDDMHQRSGVLNRQLQDHETRFVESGSLPAPTPDAGFDEGVPNEAGYEREPDTPF